MHFPCKKSAWSCALGTIHSNHFIRPCVYFLPSGQWAFVICKNGGRGISMPFANVEIKYLSPTYSCFFVGAREKVLMQFHKQENEKFSVAHIWRHDTDVATKFLWNILFFSVSFFHRKPQRWLEFAANFSPFLFCLLSHFALSFHRATHILFHRYSSLDWNIIGVIYVKKTDHKYI